MYKYQLRYLPQFDQDLKDCVLYIVNKLKNPDAAIKLIGATEQAILERLPDAEAFEQYHSRKDRRYPYYRIYFNVLIPQTTGPC